MTPNQDQIQQLTAQLAAAREALRQVIAVADRKTDEFDNARKALATPSPAADALLAKTEQFDVVVGVLENLMLPPKLYGADNENYLCASITLGEWLKIRAAIDAARKASTKEGA